MTLKDLKRAKKSAKVWLKAHRVYCKVDTGQRCAHCELIVGRLDYISDLILEWHRINTLHFDSNRVLFRAAWESRVEDSHPHESIYPRPKP